MTPVPQFTLPNFAAFGAGLAVFVTLALVAATVLRGRRRYPQPVAVFVIVLVFVLALVTAQVAPTVIAALVGTASVVAVRLSRPRNREI